MIGQAFFCNGCHRFRPTQDGYLVDLLNHWNVGDHAPQSSTVRETTAGVKVGFAQMVICHDCLPPGVEALSLSDVGLRPEDSHESATTVQEYLRRVQA